MYNEKLSLLKGGSLKLSDKLSIKHPTLAEIESFGQEQYMSLLFALISTSLDIADILFMEMGVWYEDIKSEWDFFIQKCTSNDLKKENIAILSDGKLIKVLTDCPMIDIIYKDSLNYFLDLDYEYTALRQIIDGNPQTIIFGAKRDNNGNLYIDDNSNKFTKHYYELATAFLREVNWIDSDYDFVKGGNKTAKRYMLKMMYQKRQRNKKKKPNITLDSIVSSLIVKMQDYKHMWDYPIYVIYDVYHRIYKIQEYDNTVMGYYNGKFDTTKSPINWDKVNWSSVINK